MSALLDVFEVAALAVSWGLDEAGRLGLIAELIEHQGAAPWRRATVVRLVIQTLRQQQERDRQSAQARLLDGNQGQAIGLEMRHQTAEQWAAIFPDASEPGRFRHQYFDARGFFAHSAFDTPLEALDDAVRDGFTVPAPGVLDRLAATEEWADGLKALAEIQRRNEESWARRQTALPLQI